MRRLSIIALVTALAVTACGGDAEDPLVVYSGRSEELVQPLIDSFEESTGLEVDVRYADSTELAATLHQEGEASEADVFFAQDPASLGSVAGMMTELPADVLGLVEARFADADGHWVGTSGRVRVFVHNTATDNDLPDTIDDVVTDQWAGKLGVAPTNGSFLAFVAAMILERGEDATLRWLQALAELEPQDFPGNSPIVTATDNGEIEAGLVNHYYLFRLRAEGAGQNAENWFIPAGDVGSLVMPAGVGILSTSERSEAALELVEFLLGEEAQTYFATETFEYPLIKAVDPVEGLPSLATIETPDIALSDLADVLDDATRLVTQAGLV